MHQENTNRASVETTYIANLTNQKHCEDMQEKHSPVTCILFPVQASRPGRECETAAWIFSRLAWKSGEMGICRQMPRMARRSRPSCINMREPACCNTARWGHITAKHPSPNPCRYASALFIQDKVTRKFSRGAIIIFRYEYENTCRR